MSSDTYYVGIDPGNTGAIALIHGSIGVLVHALVSVPRASGKGRELDLPHAIACFADLAAVIDHAGGVCVIERQQARPQQGASSALQLGRAWGQVEALAAGHGWRVISVAPSTWTKALGLAKGADKEAKRAMARRLFPAMDLDLKLKGDHHKAEALLIAEHGRRAGL